MTIYQTNTYIYIVAAIDKFTPIDYFDKKLILSQTKDNNILSFRVEHYTLVLFIIKHYSIKIM